MDRCHTLVLYTELYNTLLPLKGYCLFASIIVESKTKCIVQKSTNSQDLAMCLTVNNAFELLDPLVKILSLHNLLPKEEFNL